MRESILSCALSVVCLLSAADAASPSEVWVITDRTYPVKVSPSVRIIELDGASRIEAELAADLPSDPALAVPIAAQRLKDGGVLFQRRLAAAYQGVVDAWSLSIEKIPAVVVDRQYVVYGESNVDRALQKIADFRSARR